jgi:hypothetical protein
LAEEPFARGTDERPQRLHISGASLGYRDAGFDDLTVPSAHKFLRALGLQSRIPLAERSLETLPRPDKPWFHVEHTPIEVAATLLWTLLDQLMQLGVYRLDGEHSREFRDSADSATIEPRLKPGSPKPQPENPRAVRTREVPNSHQAVGATADQRLVPRTSERSRSAQKVDGLKETGLARRICADDQVPTRVKRQVRGLDAPDVLDLQPIQPHPTAG